MGNDLRTARVAYAMAAEVPAAAVRETVTIAYQGEIDHRDVFFSDHQKQENRKICACVSRARGTITVDTLQRADAV